MNWAAFLYFAGLWALAAALSLTLRRPRSPTSDLQLAWEVTRDLLPGLLLAIVAGRV
ncbi:MAG: hypothetical protein IRY97_04865, partial [Thermomicrobiaceae bacterium]|nr:hypothetical protein [Thermomicrobiaceae bacterium]